LHDPSHITTFLFTDIEGSTRLWESEPERMRPAMARHDALARQSVEEHGGVVVKMTGDGVHAAFDDALDAVRATVALQRSLAEIEPRHGVAIRVRCGLHAGAFERRDNDFFGAAVNRAARIMGAAHGGQVLLSRAVAELVAARLSDGLALRDLGAARLRDVPDTERLFQVLHPALRADFPALRGLEATPHNLPHALTSFIGRERELSEVRARLATARLLTLTGMGGLGKSRLALEAAARLLDDYPDGVWLVELAALRDPQGVAQALASVLGVKPEPGRPVSEALELHVRERRLLVLLDNCEHVLGACAELALRLLRAAPHVKILASSREPLRVTGEALVAVPALAVPSVLAAGERLAIEAYEAVRLFIERATAAQPAFALTAANAGAVAAICHRVDGIPLALELAAARVRSLTVHQIAERLKDRLRLLVGGDPTALPRQQTLRGLIDWSHDLLEPGERTLFRRLAVFAGGCTPEAAEAVAAGGTLAAADVADRLARLAEKSLVSADPHTGRYRLLETVREYAQQKLDESGEGPDCRLRHLRYYVGIAEVAKQGLAGSGQAAWLALLDVERENILAAHEAAEAAAGGTALGLALANALKRYWINAGLLETGYRVTCEALARQSATERDFVRMRGLFDAGQLGFFMGRYADARQRLEESLSIARALADPARIAMVLAPLGLAALGQGELSVARRAFEESIALARDLGDRRQLGTAQSALGHVRRMEGDHGAAHRLYAEVVALGRAEGDLEMVAIGLLNLAIVAVERGRLDDARGPLAEAEAIAATTLSQRVGQGVLEVACGMASAAGEWERAARLLGAADAQAARAGLHRDPADDAFLAPRIDAALGGLGGAAFNRAHEQGRAGSLAQSLAEARDWLATCR
jgi:predicted ATPase/class 3 adenylate cyclase